MDDNRSDEQLAEASRQGDKPALEILLNRYSTIILAFLGGKSFFYKDEPYLDDIRQEVLIKVFNGIRDFTSTGPGSFKRWVFRIAYFETLNHDKARRKGMKLTSEVFTEETIGIPDDLVWELTPRISDYDRADEQLVGQFRFSGILPTIVGSNSPDPAEAGSGSNCRTIKDALAKLSDDEQKLLQLVAQDTPYGDIIKRPEFSKYKSVDYLMLKVHNIRKKLSKL